MRELAGAVEPPSRIAIPTLSPPGHAAASLYVYQHGAGLPSAQGAISVVAPPATSVTLQSSPSSRRKFTKHDRCGLTIGAASCWYVAFCVHASTRTPPNASTIAPIRTAGVALPP